MNDKDFETLVNYLSEIPAVRGTINTGIYNNGNWWVKFTIDLEHVQAWNTVQELGHVLNYLSLNEKLPTIFMPVSPPPYLNGAAKEFLSWVIESTAPDFKPGTCKKWLEGRLPRPVTDPEQWPDIDE